MAPENVTHRARCKHQAQLRHDIGKELIEQRAAQQPDNVLMKLQTVGADGAPVLALPRQLCGFQGLEHPVGLIVTQGDWH
jgi:CheY-like chemotaxis protein